MKRETELKLRQLLVITCAWVVMGFIITVYDYLLLHTHYSLGPTEEYTFLSSAIRNMGAGLIGAILGGTYMVFYINVKYQDKPYGYTIISTSISFILIVALISVIMGILLVPIEPAALFYDPVSRAALRNFLIDSAPVKATIVWSFIVAGTQLLLQVYKKFGYGSFWNIMRGKYNTPKEEKKIFMFLDINSSTTIAEKLGDERYHSLLKDFFADITRPILNNNGSIYQYVGDEVIVAWNNHDGTENNQCLKCFFDIKDRINAEKSRYLSRYGLVPTFKAGIHCGKVVAGEIGIIKRDITYSGDVLNTTSRIQSMCKKFKVDVIASIDLIEQLRPSDKYTVLPLGSIKLRGKRKEMLLNQLKLLNALDS